MVDTGGSEFSKAQSLASLAAGSTTISTNTVKLATFLDKRRSTINDQVGRTRRAIIRVQVEGTALKAAGAGTLNIVLYTKASASSMASGTALVTAKAVVTANNSTSNPSGTVLADIPIPDSGLLQFFALGYAAVTQNITAGKVTAWIDYNHESGVGE